MASMSYTGHAVFRLFIINFFFFFFRWGYAKPNAPVASSGSGGIETVPEKLVIIRTSLQPVPVSAPALARLNIGFDDEVGRVAKPSAYLGVLSCRKLAITLRSAAW
jgi:hypothetical protein